MVNDEGGGDLRVLLVGVYRFTPHEAGVERRVGKGAIAPCPPSIVDRAS
jgi:hypothetical protein